MLTTKKPRQSIIDEICRMKIEYSRQTGNRPTIVCLDAYAELRLTSYIIDQIEEEERKPNSYKNMFWWPHTVKDIMKKGIRDLKFSIYGLELRFGCSEFRIGTFWDGSHFG